jgi:hypothetical protein
MPQIINERSFLSNMSSGLGQGIGSGLSGLLEGVVAKKAQKQQRSKLAEKLQALGIKPEEASAISYLDPKVQQAYLTQKAKQPSQQALASLFYGQETPYQEHPDNQLSQMQPQAQQPQLQTALQQLTGLQPSVTEQNMLQALVPQNNAQIQAPVQEKQQPNVPAQPNRQEQIARALRMGLINPQQALAFEQAERKRQESQERLALQKEQLQKKGELEQAKLSRAEQRDIDKETLPFYNEVTKEAKAAKNNLQRLDRMEALLNKGNLAYPLWASTLKTAANGIFGFGIDLTSLLNADSQEFDKLSTDFVKDAKSYFGSRLTDTDLKTFLRTVPTLSMSNDGKQRVMNSLKSFNSAALLKKKAVDSIISENGGKRPRNIDELVEKRVGPELEALANKVKEDSSAPIELDPRKIPGSW